MTPFENTTSSIYGNTSDNVGDQTSTIISLFQKQIPELTKLPDDLHPK